MSVLPEALKYIKTRGEYAKENVGAWYDIFVQQYSFSLKVVKIVYKKQSHEKKKTISLDAFL